MGLFDCQRAEGKTTRPLILKRGGAHPVVRPRNAHVDNLLAARQSTIYFSIFPPRALR